MERIKFYNMDFRVVWHLGHGLEKAWVPLDSKGRVTPTGSHGETLVLGAVVSGCSQDKDIQHNDTQHNDIQHNDTA